MSRARAAGACAAALAVLVACTGVLDAPGGGSSSAVAPGGPGSQQSGGSGGGQTTPDPGKTVADLCADPSAPLALGRTRLRRLTRAQYDNTVRDLLGATGRPASVISPDEQVGPFYSNAIAPITDLIVQQHQEVAAALAAAAVARMAELSPCDLSTAPDDACAGEFIATFGARAYRRPLSDAELPPYLALYQLGRDNGGAGHGFQLVVEAMLQAPSFLYHSDLGETGVLSAQPQQLTSYELASRLSYFLWNTMPDEELFARAEDDSLRDSTTLGAQIDRMLNDPRARNAVPEFHLQWLGVAEMEDLVKDVTLFPSFSAELVSAMQNETRNFSDYVVRQGDGLLGTLLTASYSLIEGPLFALYGVAEPAGFQPGSLVELNGAERAGLLTQAAFLAQHAHRDQTSPVHRGIFVRENLLCYPIPSPPPEVNNTPPPASTATTTRERFAEHEANPNCSGCHLLIDPIGLGFEHYDPIGRYRTSDGDFPVDATGQLTEVEPALMGSFDGAIELASKLAGSQQVADCVAAQWFRFALGRMEAADDACAMKAIQQQFDASNHDVRQLLKTIALSDAFRNVRTIGVQGGMQ